MTDGYLDRDGNELKDCVEIETMNFVEREIVIDDVVDDKRENLDE